MYTYIPGHGSIYKKRNGKLKVKLDTKKYRLIKGCDLQLYEGVAFSPNSKSQTEEESFEY